MKKQNSPFCDKKIPKEPDYRDSRNYKFCFQEMHRDDSGNWCCPTHGKHKEIDNAIQK